MREVIIVVITLLTNAVYGQQLTFGGYPVDTISISGSSGYYHFDKKGTTTGREDIYTIAYNKNTNNYVVSGYQKVFIVNTCRPDTSIRKIKHLKQDKRKVISNVVLNDLLAGFNSRYNKPSFESVGYDKEKFLSLTDEQHIRKIAKAYKQDWHFKMSYSSKEENKIIFDGCQNIDTFNLFIATKFDTSSSYITVTDFWDEIWVRIKTTQKSFSYEGKYPNTFKQPWYEHPDTSISTFIVASIINFNINKTLSIILPDKFYRRPTIELNALTNQYIKWYLKRREILDSFD
jgi:hypothetical protein